MAIDTTTPGHCALAGCYQHLALKCQLGRSGLLQHNLPQLGTLSLHVFFVSVLPQTGQKLWIISLFYGYLTSIKVCFIHRSIKVWFYVCYMWQQQEELSINQVSVMYPFSLSRWGLQVKNIQYMVLLSTSIMVGV